MSLSASSTRQVHTVLGGGIRYETAELVLSTIPNFELKQKGRILHLFTEIYVFMQEIQEALDERQNNIDSLLADHQANIPLAEPLAFESQIDTDTYPLDLSSKSIDESTNHRSDEIVPSLTVPDEREQSEIYHGYQQRSNWTSVEDSMNIKKEVITPPKVKRRRSKHSSHSKQKALSAEPPMRQMTMTQLFDPLESPKSTSIKREPETPGDDTMMLMPESLIGLAQPSESMSDDDEPHNLFNRISSRNTIRRSPLPSFKRKSVPSPTLTDDNPDQTAITTDEEEENIQNEAILQSPYAGIESEELLYACPMCRNYWLGLPDELRHKEGLTCRHRQRPVVHTPEHFWSLGIPSTQTCIERGYGGVLPPDKPIERPRRPRRQYQRRILEQHQHEQNTDEEEEE